MRNAMLTVTAMIFGILLQSTAANACSAVSAGAALETFQCVRCNGESDPLESNILTISGSIVLTNRRSTPELASLVVELEARIGSTYVTVARRVLNEAGDDVVENCEGFFAEDPLPGRLVLVDGAGAAISFASVKHLMEGATGLRYIASFTGAIPGLDPGNKVRVRTYATAFNTHASGTCTLDANNDGSTDFSVKTHVTRTNLKVPAMTLALMP